MTDTTPLLEARHISKFFGSVNALRDGRAKIEGCDIEFTVNAPHNFFFRAGEVAIGATIRGSETRPSATSGM